MGEIFGEVGQINDKYYELKPITVAMVQTLSNRLQKGVQARDDLATFQTLVVDECHRAGSKTYKNVFKHCDAYARVFLSGTALDSDDVISKLDSIAMSGPKLAEVSKRELMDKGISTQVEVRMHLSNTIVEEEPKDYRSYIDKCVHYSRARVEVIRKLVGARTGPMIIAVDKIEHGQFIHECLNDPNVVFTHGEDRQQLQKIQQFKDGEFPVLMATAILSEGVNLPKVREIVYAVGGKSKVSVKQWAGRSERLDESKDKAIFHDFYDIGDYVCRHSERRLKMYRDEDLPVLLSFDLALARRLDLVAV